MAASKTAKTVAKPKQPDYALHSFFPTNVLSRDFEGKDIDALNDELKLELWRQRALDPEGLYRSNLAGTWHSKDDAFTETGEAGEALRDMFGKAFVEWGGVHGLKKTDSVKVRMAAWAMIYSDRGYATVHTHPNCHVSGVYYVDDTTGREEKTMATGVTIRSGDIEFVDTRKGGEHQLKGIRLNPSAIVPFKKGRMLIFPSALPHFVHPIVGPGERIAIACNGTFLSA